MRIRIGFIIAGIAIGFFNAKELLLSTKTADTPANITCAELIANGPGNNYHLILDDVIAYGDWYVFGSKTGKKDRPYDFVYLPLLPFGGQWHTGLLAMLDEEGNIQGDVPPPSDIHVIAKFTDVRHNRELVRMVGRDTFQGVIINDIDSLDSKERELLQQGYPGVDFEKCWIFEVGRKPDGIGFPIIMILAGLALTAAGIWLPVSRRRPPKPKKPVAQPAEPAAEPPVDTLQTPSDDNPYAQV